MILYKLTDQGGYTREETHWDIGILHGKVDKQANPRLCSSDVVHAYRDPDVALLLNPIHANISNPLIWEVKGVICVEDWGKVGCYDLRVVRKYAIPQWYMHLPTRLRVIVAFAKLCSSASAAYADAYAAAADAAKAAAEAAAHAAAAAAKAAAEAAYAAADAASDAAYAAADAASDAADAAAYTYNHAAAVAAYNAAVTYNHTAAVAAYNAAVAAYAADDAAAYNYTSFNVAVLIQQAINEVTQKGA